VVYKQEKPSIVDLVTPANKPYVVYELLGGSPQDLLLPRNFLIVEGQSELQFLTRIIARHFGDKPIVQIIPAQGDTDQAKRTINSIEKAYSPLGKTLYGNKVIILCDQPSQERQAGVNDFLQRYRRQSQNNQIYFLPLPAIEECYPDREGWRRTHEQQEAMNGRQKLQLAKRVGDGITQHEFESDLVEVFKALTRCWELAF
jgi:hypothetical protein